MDLGQSSHQTHHLVMRVFGQAGRGDYGQLPPDVPAWADPDDYYICHHKNCDHSDNRVEVGGRVCVLALGTDR